MEDLNSTQSPSLGQFSSSYWLNERFDLPISKESLRTCLICTTPRVGSHYLASIMSSTDTLGRPFEYFHQKNLETWKTHSNSIDYASTLSHIVGRRTTANGLFSVKAHWHQFSKMKESYPAAIDQLNINYYIYLSRKDQLDQAISRVIARQTKSFISLAGTGSKKPVYSRESIKNNYRKICEGIANWKNYFLNNQIEPLEICYEEFIDNQESALISIYSYLGIDISHHEVSDVLSNYNRNFPHKPQRQSTELNQQWKNRYLSGE